MAIRPSDKYPGQIDADANYPHGKARNVAVSGDGTGTPLEKDWLNDLFGFQQALLNAAAVAPSGTPDSVAASQYLQAAQTLMNSAAAAAASASEAKRHGARYELTGVGVAQGNKYGLTLIERSNPGYALAADEVTVPESGWYHIGLTARLQNDDASNPRGIAAAIAIGGLSIASGFAIRFSATTSHVVGIAASVLVEIAVPAMGGQISVLEASGAGNGTMVVTADRTLSIVRVA